MYIKKSWVGRPIGKLMEPLLLPIGLDGPVLVPGGWSCLHGVRLQDSTNPVLAFSCHKPLAGGWRTHSREAVELLLEWFPERRLEPWL